MVKAGTIHVDIQATTQQLQAGLKSAEAQVAASTKRMAQTSRVNMGGAAGMGAGLFGGALAAGGMRGIGRMIGGFGAVGALFALNRVLEETSESFNRAAESMRNARDGSEKFVAVLEGIPFLGQSVSFLKNVGLNASGNLGRMFGFESMAENLGATSEAAQAQAFVETLRIALEQARQQTNLINAPNETARLRIEREMALTDMQTKIQSLRDELSRLRFNQGKGGMDTGDRLLIGEIERELMEAINTDFFKKLNELAKKQQPDVVRPGMDDFSTSLGRVRFFQRDMEDSPANKPAKEETAKQTAAATKQTASTLSQILSFMRQSGNVGFA